MTDPTHAAQLAAWRRYGKRRRAALRDGTWQHRVPIEIVRDHIDALRARGMAVDAIAGAANLPGATVHNITYPAYQGGSRRWVMPATAAALLAVTTPMMAPDHCLIPSTGTRRRIEALQATGWPLTALAARAGVTHQAVHQWKTRTTVNAAIARQVADIYDELADWPGPESRSRAAATRRNFAAPWCWYDATGAPIDIDDPAARPYRRRTPMPEPPPPPDAVDEVAIQRAITGTGPVTLTPAERVHVVTALAARGLSDAAIAARCGVVPRTVLRTRQEHGIESRWSA